MVVGEGIAGLLELDIGNDAGFGLGGKNVTVAVSAVGNHLGGKLLGYFFIYGLLHCPNFNNVAHSVGAADRYVGVVAEVDELHCEECGNSENYDDNNNVDNIELELFLLVFHKNPPCGFTVKI